MRYPSELYRKAEAILKKRQERTRYELRQRKEALRTHYPELYAVYRDTVEQGILLGKQMLTSPPDQSDALMAAQQGRMAVLLQSLVAAGLDADYLQERPFCPRCGDKGFADDQSCECRRQVLSGLAYEWLSDISQVEDCSFDNFRLEYYQGDDALRMEKLAKSCVRYARKFHHRSPDLLFMGPPGLGKTHLSLFIARAVVNQGHLVLYASAAKLLERLVDIAFGDTQDEYRDIVYGCDLLIIDDLGTEFQTRPSTSEVYSLINTRSIEGRPTIINTNLTLRELQERYGDRVLSRLANGYTVNQFSGKDIRFQKRLEAVERRNTNGKEKAGL